MKIPEHLQSFLQTLAKELEGGLGDCLKAVYIHGSLTYGGYVRERSDIDLLVLLNCKMDSKREENLSEVFNKLSKTYPEELKNTELDTLLTKEIKIKNEVLYSMYSFSDNQPQGSKELEGFWIELSNIRENGIVLFGPSPEKIIPVIERDVLIKSNQKKFIDLQENAEEWERIDLWNQIYLLVQASRVLYSLNNNLKLVSKQEALRWAVENTPDQFTPMLEVAKEKIDNFEGPREKVISENWQEYFEYIENQF